MRASVLAIALLVAFTAVVAVAPAAEAAPPSIDVGCGELRWDNGDVREGRLPGYRYHPCD